MKKRLVLLAIGGLAAGLAVPALAADSLTVVSWGGAYQDSVRKAFFEPFMKETGDKIVEEEFNGEIAKQRAMVESGNVTWDVVENDAQAVLAGCAEGILEKIDWDKLGMKRDQFISADASECVVPSILYGTVFAYDKTKFKEAPQTIKDFFDIEFPGKRGLEKRPFVNLEWALVADGSTSRRFTTFSERRRASIAPSRSSTASRAMSCGGKRAQPPQLLADGQVTMSSAWNGRIYKAINEDKKPFAIMWDHAALDWQGWTVVKGSKKVDLAYKFMAFAGRPDRQADQTNYISYGPGNKEAIANTNPKIKPDLPTNPDNMKTGFIVNTILGR